MMKKSVLSTSLLMLTTLTYAASERTEVNVPKVESITGSIADAFTNGTISGQIRAGYIHAMPKNAAEPTTFASALGGQLKYETAGFYGFSVGAAFYTSHTISDWSGDKSLGGVQ